MTLNAIEKERKRKETFETAAARVDIHLETQVGSMASVLCVFRSAGSRPISLARREGLVSIIQSRQIRLKKSILAQSFIDTNRDGYRGAKVYDQRTQQPKEDEIFYTEKMLFCVVRILSIAARPSPATRKMQPRKSECPFSSGKHFRFGTTSSLWRGQRLERLAKCGSCSDDDMGRTRGFLPPCCLLLLRD